MSAPFIVPFNHEPIQNIANITSYTVPAGSYIKATILNAAFRESLTVTNGNILRNLSDGNAPRIIIGADSIQLSKVVLFFGNSLRNIAGTNTFSISSSCPCLFKNAILAISATGVGNTLNWSFGDSSAPIDPIIGSKAASTAVSRDSLGSVVASFFEVSHTNSGTGNVDIYFSASIENLNSQSSFNLRAGAVISAGTTNRIQSIIERFSSLT